MSKRFKLAALGAAAFAALPGLAHAEWTKTYAVEWNEPAFYNGGAKGVIDPGTDCPQGTSPEIDWVKVMVDAGYTREEATWIRNPANPTRSPVHGQNQMAFRGQDRANVYINPTSTPEVGLPGVTGTVGEGINLDGDATTGFTSPAGEKGIDNAFYATLGCWKTYRAPAHQSSGALQFNDAMREGSWTMIVVVSGKGSDPMNDPSVTLGLYASPDKLVKDGNGNVAHDYTFRIKPDAKYEAVFKAKTVKGRVISTEAMSEVMLRNPGYDRDLDLLKARIDFQMQPDGGLKGYVGGYRPWMPVYKGWVGARGPVIESLTWVRLPDVYYALKRGADYSPTGPKGEKTHISYAIRVEAVPAFVMMPDATKPVTVAQSFKAQAPAPATALAGATPPPTSFNVIDGIVVPKGAAAVSQSAELLRPPGAAKTGGAGGAN